MLLVEALMPVMLRTTLDMMELAEEGILSWILIV